MMKLISRVLVLAVAAIVAGAVFVAAMTIWSWWSPAGSVSSDEQFPPGSDTPVRLEPARRPR